MVEAMLKFSSNWSSPAFSRDSFPGIDHSYSFESRNVEIDEYENFADSSENSIHSISGSSSEGSEWTSFDEDINNILPVTDGSVSMLLEEGLVDSINVSDLNWAELEPFADQTTSNASIIESTGVSHVSRKNGKRKKSDHQSSASQWSMMSRDEQLKTLQALTPIISHNMTLRQQIEIIRVINPSAVISPNDTEFAIDLEFLNDSKLQVIKDIVNKHAIVSSHSDLGELQTSVICNGSPSPHQLPSKVKSSKKQVYEKRSYLKEIESRQRKLLRQNKKEKRSGLFLHEKKIKRLCSSSRDEEENVNILD